MKKIMPILTALCVLYSCSATKKSGANSKTIESNTDKGYGYSQQNPIKVGGDVLTGPAREREYLNSLEGPNGEKVSFHRLGSCCPFETKNSPLGGGLLDKYAVYYTGIKDTVFLYLNMYDKGELRVPGGFVRNQE